MKALVKKKAEPGLWLEEVPIPEPGINDVLIRIEKTSIDRRHVPRRQDRSAGDFAE